MRLLDDASLIGIDPAYDGRCDILTAHMDRNKLHWSQPSMGDKGRSEQSDWGLHEHDARLHACLVAFWRPFR